MRERELYRAIMENNVALAREIIATRNVDVNHIDREGDNDGSVRDKFLYMTPLWFAIMLELLPREKISVIETEDFEAIDGLATLLLERGADPNKKSDTGATPFESFFHYYDLAPPEKSRAMFDLLVGMGANEDCLWNEVHKEKFLQLSAAGRRFCK